VLVEQSDKTARIYKANLATSFTSAFDICDRISWYNMWEGAKTVLYICYFWHCFVNMFHFCFSPHHPLIIHIKTDFCTSPFSRKLNCQHTVPQACQVLEILLYIYCITFHNAYVRYLEYHVYIVAIMNCIWFESLDCGYTWALLNTTCLFQLHRRSLLWSHC